MAKTSSTSLTISTFTYTGGAKSYTLECKPAGGTHPYPYDACSTLKSVKGDFKSLKSSEDILCSFDYQPFTVSVIGRYKNKSVNFREVYSNQCFAIASLDGIVP
ncbi:subtilisin inhibitor [Gilbertella persicaria]|uniref:subtilisin inhibitor n=1 Tax=Gilbertella persicaria TaxID=101096 RepID=UPI00221E61A1|nr:subtilisin inhibitor [Gilbertella persicaria]KAI8076527.1 subtilisin inhibitor [Gilbertella persicaria]